MNSDPYWLNPGCGYNADIPVVRGNSHPPMQWQFLVSENPDVLFDLTGSVFKFTLNWRGGSVERSSDVDADLTVDYDNSILVWSYTTAQSRELPLGRLSRYEVERWIGGTQRTLVCGYVIVSEGSNPD